ncbi:MAG: MarR family transcriptional regulator [Pseudomonadota bacterium]
MVWKQSDPVFGFLLHDISRMLRKRFDRRARDLGLTKSQWIVLAHLARHEGIHQSGLAEILEIEPITLARHLDRLQETGWIERQSDPNDRRAWKLHMTDKAGPILHELAVLVDETMEEALTGLSDDERSVLFEMLQTVRGNLSDREPAEAPSKAERKPDRRKKANGRASHAAS